jgi:hypothetical protein
MSLFKKLSSFFQNLILKNDPQYHKVLNVYITAGETKIAFIEGKIHSEDPNYKKVYRKMFRTVTIIKLLRCSSRVCFEKEVYLPYNEEKILLTDILKLYRKAIADNSGQKCVVYNDFILKFTLQNYSFGKGTHYESLDEC